jgi:hypothetical protein
MRGQAAPCASICLKSIRPASVRSQALISLTAADSSTPFIVALSANDGQPGGRLVDNLIQPLARAKPSSSRALSQR